jgi:P4 family phage/plasmid primase-like protien
MHPTLNFLSLLDPTTSATFNIETFTDLPKGAVKPKPDPLCNRYANLTLADVSSTIPQLEELNAAGAAIYVAVNQFKGQRNKLNLARVRGVHGDFDGVSEETLTAVRNLLPPTIEVQSSFPGNCHFYWLLDEGEEVSLEWAESINRGIVELGADRAAIDVSRLLRLPGFRHLKHREGEGTNMGIHIFSEQLCPTVKVVATNRRYREAQINAALPKSTTKAKPKNTNSEGHFHSLPLTSDHLSIVDAAVAHLAEANPKLWAGEWDVIRTFGKKQLYPSQSEADMSLASRIAHYLVEQGVPPDALYLLTEAVFGLSGLAVRDKWQSREDYKFNTISRACASAMENINTTISGDVSAKAPTPHVDWSLHGDVRNARFFADKWNGVLAYVYERKKWMHWGYSRWAMCFAGEEVERAKETCRAIYTAAGQELAKDPEKSQKLVREAAQAHLSQRIKAMLDLAQSDPTLAVSSTRLDADNYLLGVENGVVDLRKASLRPNEPGLFITRYCNANFDPNAECPRWLQFLDEIFQGDQATITSVQRLLGYTLTGLNTEEFLVFCVGFGANGKSIFGNVVGYIVGDYGKTAPSTLLAARRGDDHSARSDLAMLDGARMVSVNELPAGMRLDEQVVKQVAGREPISARHLYGEFFTFQPRFTVWVRTNHKPIIKGDDDGIWRRVIVLPFRRKFEPHEQDPRLEGKLLAERDGILRWMVEGAQKYLKQGMYFSPMMQAERKQFRKDSDMLGEFLEERTSAKPNGKVEQSRLYSSWVAWCDGNGTQPGSKKTFTQRLAERGFPAGKSNDKRYYVGLTPNPSNLF